MEEIIMASTSANAIIPRPEHPRPDFVRPDYINLNGEWQFAFDDGDIGLKEKWYKPGKTLDKTIIVPFCYQCEASGISGDEIHPVIWYRRKFEKPENLFGDRLLIKFGAVDYRCSVYVNGEMAGSHVGGYSPFELDITHLVIEGENDLCLRIEDEPDCTQPRGKQLWHRGLMGCWYTPTSGIWQTVWMESAADTRIKNVHITPDVDNCRADFGIILNHIPRKPLTAAIEVTFEGTPLRTVVTNITGRITHIAVDMHDGAWSHSNSLRLWSPGHPNLYDVNVRILDGDKALDDVTTYFGMRKVEVVNGQVLINNMYVYQRLVLDQGYWPDTLITPPSDEAIQKDLQLTREFGFNGARKHQKMEDPRYYYWADKMGLLVWGEVPSPYEFSQDTAANLSQTLRDFIERDYNHPSIITWVPINESWGVRDIYNNPVQQATARMLYQQAKAMDGTRLVSSNDGWEQVETDICAIHDYVDTAEKFALHFPSREAVERTTCDFKMAFCNTTVPTGKEAFMVTEYGGIAMSCIGAQGEMGGMETWGYHGKETDPQAFLSRYKDITDAVRALDYCHGYCYTQLTDVQQEINGLVTPDRKPKVDPALIREINRSPERTER